MTVPNNNNNVVVGGILNTRHARTLSYLFQSKLLQHQQEQELQPTVVTDNDTTMILSKKQTLVLVITTGTTLQSDNVIDAGKLIQDLHTLFQVVGVGSSKHGTKVSLNDVYDIQIVPVTSSSSSSSSLDSSKVRLLFCLHFLIRLYGNSSTPFSLSL